MLTLDMNKVGQKEVVLKEDNAIVKTKLGEDLGVDFELRILPLTNLQKTILIHESEKEVKEKESRAMTNADLSVFLARAQLKGWSGIEDAKGDVIEYNEENLNVLSELVEIQFIINTICAKNEDYIIKKKPSEVKSNKK